MIKNPSPRLRKKSLLEREKAHTVKEKIIRVRLVSLVERESTKITIVEVGMQELLLLTTKDSAASKSLKITKLR